MDKKIYVLWVTTGAERWAAERLRWMRSRGQIPEEVIDSPEDIWMPTRAERRKVRGEETIVDMPLFKSYLFVTTDCPEKLNSILKEFRPREDDKGFFGILRSDLHSATVGTDETAPEYGYLSDLEIATIQKLSTHGEEGISTAIVRDGEIVIVDGPLKGFEKYIVKVDRHKRKATLEMIMFDLPQRFVIPLDVVDGTLPTKYSGLDASQRGWNG